MRVRFESFRQYTDSAGRVYTQIRRQPSWVLQAAGLAVLLCIAVPILLLVLAALVAGVVVFVLLSVLRMPLVWLRRWRSRGSNGGRRGVYVVHHRD